MLLHRFEKLDIPPPPSEAPFVFDLSRFTRDERDELKAVLIAFRDGHATEEDHTSMGRFVEVSNGRLRDSLHEKA